MPVVNRIQPDVNRIQPQSNKFALGVENKATGVSKHHDSSDTHTMKEIVDCNKWGYLFNSQLKGLRQEIEIRMKNSVKHGQTVSPEVLNLRVMYKPSNFFVGACIVYKL